MSKNKIQRQQLKEAQKATTWTKIGAIGTIVAIIVAFVSSPFFVATTVIKEPISNDTAQKITQALGQLQIDIDTLKEKTTTGEDTQTINQLLTQIQDEVKDLKKGSASGRQTITTTRISFSHKPRLKLSAADSVPWTLNLLFVFPGVLFMVGIVFSFYFYHSISARKLTALTLNDKEAGEKLAQFLEEDSCFSQEEKIRALTDKELSLLLEYLNKTRTE